MSYVKKQEIILKAFHEGAILVMNELNAGDIPERLINAVLTGKTEDGVAPRTPGFLLIASQNAVTKVGRAVFSEALERRLMKVILPDYTKEELMEILLQKYKLPQDKIVGLYNDYNTARQMALQSRLKPLPCFRDLIREAKNIVDDEFIMQNQDMLCHKKREISSAAAYGFFATRNIEVTAQPQSNDDLEAVHEFIY